MSNRYDRGRFDRGYGEQEPRYGREYGRDRTQGYDRYNNDQEGYNRSNEPGWGSRQYGGPVYRSGHERGGQYGFDQESFDQQGRNRYDESGADYYGGYGWEGRMMGETGGRNYYGQGNDYERGSQGRQGQYGQGRYGRGQSDQDYEDYGRGSQFGQGGQYSQGYGLQQGGRYQSQPQTSSWTYVEIWAIPGPHSGRGPRNYQRSDERIREDVNERLTQNGQLDASNMEIEVTNGEVMLKGNVNDRRDKRLAEDIADSVFGVKDVNNQLKVSQGEQTDSSQQQQLGVQSQQTQTAQGGEQSRQKERATTTRTS